MTNKSHTELREQRRINRAALKVSTTMKQKIMSDTSLSTRQHCPEPSSSNKSNLVIVPDQPHSRNTDSSESEKRTIPTLDVGNGDEITKSTESANLRALHQTRQTNVSDAIREKKTNINFPPPHDSTWKSINEEIKIALPLVFPKRRLNSLTTSEASAKLTRWLHDFCIQKFGAKPQNQNQNYKSKTNSPRKNKRLE